MDEKTEAEKIKQDIKKYFTHRSHGFDHVMRVYRMAVKIAEKEKADLKLVKAAALLHDIARTDELNGKDVCHAEKGAEMCIPILKKHNFKEDEIKIISDAIKTHRYKNQLKPTSKTGEILQDADRLDVLGTIGIARIFARSGELGRPFHDPKEKPAEKYESKANTAINHFYEKILNITPDTFHTETARKIAKSRYRYTKEFIQRFLKEWKGD